MLDGNAGVLYTRQLFLKGAIGTGYRRQIPGLIYRYVTGKATEAEVVEFGSRCQEGLALDRAQGIAAECFAQSLKPRITREGQEEVRRHLLRGHLVILASGSPYPIVAETGKFLGAHIVIASRLKVADGRFTGEIEAPLSFQEGKRERVLAVLERFGVEESRATLYSDSPADLPLFEAVGKPVVINPRSEFEDAARGRGWEIREWKTRLGKPRPGKQPDPIEALLAGVG
jgi:HAD superfamily hydrolase (TIGR01490 family)